MSFVSKIFSNVNNERSILEKFIHDTCTPENAEQMFKADEDSI